MVLLWAATRDGIFLWLPLKQLQVRTYSEWVIDGEYDWPPTCSMCHDDLEAEKDPQTTRLGCLRTFSSYMIPCCCWTWMIFVSRDSILFLISDVIHTKCLVSHIQTFPPQTAPAGYVCPECSSPVSAIFGSLRFSVSFPYSLPTKHDRLVSVLCVTGALFIWRVFLIH